MSTNRRVLKIVSLIQFVLAVGVIVLAILAKVGGDQSVESHEWGETVRLYLDLPAFILFGALSIGASITGIHGANRPSRLGSHMLLCILGILFGIVAMVISGAGAGVPVAPALDVVACLVGTIFDARVRKEVERRLDK
ncbi:hypothetical protein [Paratractidigestivibacter sp.]|uniref:hypothetical protein n=1 Tax=Paratractidigestivibacter sp. TaxID=2847316 RepID=UPI002ABE4B92|nr:hypothetical protein [Paratractidigestivibacter sp.]